MGYKKSKFNIIKSINGKQLMYNTYSGHVIEMDDLDMHYILDSNFINIDSSRMESYLKKWICCG